jgi:hypothetical protein
LISVEYIEAFFEQGLNEDKIAAKLQTICDIAPQGSFRTECDTFVQTNAIAVMRALDKGMVESCSVVGLCPQFPMDSDDGIAQQTN